MNLRVVRKLFQKLADGLSCLGKAGIEYGLVLRAVEILRRNFQQLCNDKILQTESFVRKQRDQFLKAGRRIRQVVVFQVSDAEVFQLGDSCEIQCVFRRWIIGVVDRRNHEHTAHDDRDNGENDQADPGNR